jgi:hypothetical protein
MAECALAIAADCWTMSLFAMAILRTPHSRAGNEDLAP